MSTLRAQEYELDATTSRVTSWLDQIRRSGDSSARSAIDAHRTVSGGRPRYNGSTDYYAPPEGIHHDDDRTLPPGPKSPTSKHRQTNPSQEEVFKRRQRHKTRPDRYDTSRGKENAPPKRRKASPTRKKGRSRRQHIGAEAMNSFSSEAVSQERITVKPTLTAGMFLNGRSSKAQPIMDLSYNEIAFLGSNATRKEAGQLRPTSLSTKHLASSGRLFGCLDEKGTQNNQHDVSQSHADIEPDASAAVTERVATKSPVQESSLFVTPGPLESLTMEPEGSSRDRAESYSNNNAETETPHQSTDVPQGFSSKDLNSESYQDLLQTGVLDFEAPSNPNVESRSRTMRPIDSPVQRVDRSVHRVPEASLQAWNTRQKEVADADAWRDGRHRSLPHDTEVNRGSMKGLAQSEELSGIAAQPTPRTSSVGPQPRYNGCTDLPRVSPLIAAHYYFPWEAFGDNSLPNIPLSGGEDRASRCAQTWLPSQQLQVFEENLPPNDDRSFTNRIANDEAFYPPMFAATPPHMPPDASSLTNFPTNGLGYNPIPQLAPAQGWLTGDPGSDTIENLDRAIAEEAAADRIRRSWLGHQQNEGYSGEHWPNPAYPDDQSGLSWEPVPHNDVVTYAQVLPGASETSYGHGRRNPSPEEQIRDVSYFWQPMRHY